MRRSSLDTGCHEQWWCHLAFKWGMCRHLRQFSDIVKVLLKVNIMHDLINFDDVHEAHSQLLRSESLNLQYAALLELAHECRKGLSMETCDLMSQEVFPLSRLHCGKKYHYSLFLLKRTIIIVFVLIQMWQHDIWAEWEAMSFSNV